MASRGGPRTRGNAPGRGGAAPGGPGRGGSRAAGISGGSTAKPAASATEKPKRENIVDLSRYMDKPISITFTGGRQVNGTLKGFDQLMNLVLDDVQEELRGL